MATLDVRLRENESRRLTITQQEAGLSGFLDRFRQAGVGNAVSSWFRGEAKSIPPDTVEKALGRDTIQKIASKAGLSLGAAATAIAFMLPRLVQRLAPGGAVPSRLPADVMSYVTGPTGAIASGARQAAYTAEAAVQQTSSSRYVWPVLALLAIILLLGVWLVRRDTGFDSAERVRLASEKASAALAALRPGFSASDLVSALNLYVINFPAASAQIPPESTAFLDKAAVAIKVAPSGTLIEIDGNTDNTGDPASNLVLSQQRANAVRVYLVQQGVDSSTLAARGNGDTKPVASNDTEEGRFRNRRIEFIVLR
jgi:outer membrane protein OmpA-like peptidoglycan-associated protein